MAVLSREAKAALVLSKAADLIEEKGWIKGAYKAENGYCALGAMQDAIGQLKGVGEASMTPACDILIKELNISTKTRWSFIPSWNDHKSRRKSHVVNALRRASKRAEKLATKNV